MTLAKDIIRLLSILKKSIIRGPPIIDPSLSMSQSRFANGKHPSRNFYKFYTDSIVYIDSS